MADSWGPDRDVRRAVHALAVVGVCLIALGAAYGALWLLGVGAWLFMAAVGIDLFRRP
ncbi:hypothetical protein [Streptomyces sp. NPDC002057]|uniref:hypothetical protein n=1 Tax=Streptomyces sp. NPDC002057 TaxID=3154664 RepID=UPI00331B14CE